MRDVPLFIGTVLCLFIPIMAQSKVTYEDYEKKLEEHLEKDRMLREQIAHEQALIIKYKKEIEESQKQINALKEQKLTSLGVNEDDILKARNQLDDYLDEINSVLSSSDAVFKIAISRVDTIKKEIMVLSGQAVCRLPELKNKIKVANQYLDKIAQRDSRLRENDSVDTLKNIVNSFQKKKVMQENTYTVSEVEGHTETLYNIAAKVYGDPNRWPELYKANREELDRNFKHYRSPKENTHIVHPSDLLLPGQVLVIPR